MTEITLLTPKEDDKITLLTLLTLDNNPYSTDFQEGPRDLLDPFSPLKISGKKQLLKDLNINLENEAKGESAGSENKCAAGGGVENAEGYEDFTTISQKVLIAEGLTLILFFVFFFI